MDSRSPGDVRAFVMELVEGPTLADLIVTGPGTIGRGAQMSGLWTLQRPFAIARQIALALEAAHDPRNHASQSQAVERQSRC